MGQWSDKWGYDSSARISKLLVAADTQFHIFSVVCGKRGKINILGRIEKFSSTLLIKQLKMFCLGKAGLTVTQHVRSQRLKLVRYIDLR